MFRSSSWSIEGFRVPKTTTRVNFLLSECLFFLPFPWFLHKLSGVRSTQTFLFFILIVRLVALNLLPNAKTFPLRSRIQSNISRFVLRRSLRSQEMKLRRFFKLYQRFSVYGFFRCCCFPSIPVVILKRRRKIFCLLFFNFYVKLFQVLWLSPGNSFLSPLGKTQA